MMATFERLLEDIIRLGIRDNAEFSDVTHPGIIGDMYEGLTRDIMQASILDGLDVRVTKGLICNEDGGKSRQVDCMLVTGNGKRIPHTNHDIYNINDVIAVFEVKKTLTRARLRDAFDHFAQLTQLKITTSQSEELAKAMARITPDAFRAVFRRPLPKDISAPLSAPYTPADNLMNIAIRVGAALPIFVVWGYYGHETESGFRKAIANSITLTDPCDVASRPDCIIDGDFTYIKANGMPFVGSSATTDEIVYAYTQRGLRARTLLNLIWYRLCKRFGRDFMILSDGRTFSHNTLFGFMRDADTALHVCDIDESELNTLETRTPSTESLSVEEWVAIVGAESNPIDISDSNLFAYQLNAQSNLAQEVCAKIGLSHPRRLTWTSFEELVSHLTRNKFLVVHEGFLHLVTTRCHVVITKSDIVAFENRDGRFNRLFPDRYLEYLRSSGYDFRKTTLSAFVEI